MTNLISRFAQPVINRLASSRFSYLDQIFDHKQGKVIPQMGPAFARWRVCVGTRTRWLLHVRF